MAERGASETASFPLNGARIAVELHMLASSSNPPSEHVVVESLSAQLRTHTASSHARLEQLLDLPSAIRDLRDYTGWLGRFLGFYEPLESALSAGPLPLPEQLGDLAPHAHRLVDDLRSLSISTCNLPRAPAGLLPPLPTFAHVAGARYVLTGATLGGRHILRGLTPDLSTQIGGATRFLEGGGLSGSDWLNYRNCLDELGRRYPELQVDVITGALRTFAAFHQWFVPFCGERDRTR